MTARGNWQGTLTIARLNWPFYAVAALGLMAAGSLASLSRRPALRAAGVLAGAGASYFVFGSLGVSHVIYDRSDLYRWKWLDRALRGLAVQRGVFCHAGFDEASGLLRERLGEISWQVLDHFDPRRMTEPSIQRARRLYPPVTGTLPSPFDEWPVATSSADVVFGLLAIHELRSEAERIAWFSEARRSLQATGRVVLVEHTRDLANFLAFGPGACHFHSAASWRRCWTQAGLTAIDEFKITPWVRVFVLGSL